MCDGFCFGCGAGYVERTGKSDRPGEEECREKVAQKTRMGGSQRRPISPGFADSIDKCTLISRGERAAKLIGTLAAPATILH